MSNDIDGGDPKPKLSYSQIESLEDQGRRFTGTRLDSWRDGKGICTSCRNSTIVRFESKNERIIRCSELNMTVRDDIQECSGYSNFTQLTLHQMSNLATLIGGLPERKVGFTNES